VPASAPAAAEPVAATGTPAPPHDRAVAVPLGPVVAPGTPASEQEHDDAEPDPMDVRRQIASASRSFDPDHQVRRAMDAFFSPVVPPTIPQPVDLERSTTEH
jgi:hypothetical protein